MMRFSPLIFMLFILTSHGETVLSFEELLELDLHSLSQLTVSSAAKQPENYLTSSATVYKYTAKDIQRFGWKDLNDILQAVPNIDLGNNYEFTYHGQRGLQASGRQTLILINGVPHNEIIDFNSSIRKWLMSNEIAQVEVLMGPSSTLYGSSALFGVIDIRTKSYMGIENDDTSLITIDSAQNTQIEASHVSKQENGSLGYSFAYRYDNQNWQDVKKFASDNNEFSRNASADDVRNLNPNDVILDNESMSFDWNLRHQGFRMGYHYNEEKSTQGLVRTRLQWGENSAELDRHHLYFSHELTWQNIHLNNRFIYRRQSRDFTFTNKTNASVDMSFVDAFDQAWGVDLSAFPEATDFDSLDVILQGLYADRSEEYAWQFTADYPFPDNSGDLKLGIDYKEYRFKDAFITENRSHIRPSQFFEQPNWQVASQYAQISYWHIPNTLKSVTGYRWTHDNNEQAIDSDFISPKGSLIYLFDNNQSMRFTYTEGFRQEYRKSSGIDSEKMSMYEANYSYMQKQNQSITLFNLTPYYIIADGIISESLVQDQNSDTRITQINGPKIYISGIESHYKYTSPTMSLYGSLRFLNGGEKIVNQGQSNETKKRIDAAQYKLKFGLSKALNQLEYSIEVDYWSKVYSQTLAPNNATFSVGTNTFSQKEIIEIPYFLNTHLAVSSKFINLEHYQYQVSAFIDNLLDRNNFHSQNGDLPVKYLQPERTFGLSFTLKAKD